MKIYRYPTEADVLEIIARPTKDAADLTAIVAAVLARIKNEGDAAVIDYERQFDHVELVDGIAVTPPEFAVAEAAVSDELKAALHLAHDNIARFHEAQRYGGIEVETAPGVRCWQRCKDNDGSPNVLFSVLLARAARRYDPAGEKTVSCLISVDNKAQLGNFQNYRMFVDTAYVDMPKEQADFDISKACTKARGQLMLQAQPENVMYTLKTRKAGYEKMEQMPLQMCVDVVKKAIGAHRASFCVSYANSRSFGPLDPYIREVYLLSEPNVTDVTVELSCINHHFFAMFAQLFSSEEFFRAFLTELDNAGIPYDIMRKEPFRLCGVRYDGIEGVSL